MPQSAAAPVIDADETQLQAVFPFRPVDELDFASRQLLNLACQMVGEAQTQAKVIIAGRYVLDAQIGAGSSGVVYRAHDLDAADQRVAIKVLHARARTPNDGRDALREARLLVKANRSGLEPHILGLRHVGVSNGQPYLVMNYVDGPNLRQWRRSRTRSVKEVLRTYLGAARGLRAAHANDVVHGDFKPENVLVADETGTAYVVDFGLARSMSEDARTEGVGGTRRYMAPELQRGEPATAQSDQYSFCVALFEALFERHPFLPSKPTLLADLQDTTDYGRQGREESSATRPPGRGLHVVADDPIPLVVPALKDVPEALRTVLQRGLAAEPGQRNRDMEVLTTAIAAACKSASAAAAPASRWGWATAAAVLISLLGAAPSVYSWLTQPAVYSPVEPLRQLMGVHLMQAERFESLRRYGRALEEADGAYNAAKRLGEPLGIARTELQLARLWYHDYQDPARTHAYLLKADENIALARMQTGALEPGDEHMLAEIYLLGMKNAAQRLQNKVVADDYSDLLSKTLIRDPDPRLTLLAAAGRAIVLNAFGQRAEAITQSQAVLEDLERADPQPLSPGERFTIEVNHAAFLIGSTLDPATAKDAQDVLTLAASRLAHDSPQQVDRLRVEASLAEAQEQFARAQDLRTAALELLGRVFPTERERTDFCALAFEVYLQQLEFYWRHEVPDKARAAMDDANECSRGFGAYKIDQRVRVAVMLGRHLLDSANYEAVRMNLVATLEELRLSATIKIRPSTEVELRMMLARSLYNLLWRVSSTERLGLAEHALLQLDKADEVGQFVGAPDREVKLAEIAWFRGLVLMRLERWDEAAASIQRSRSRWVGKVPPPLLDSLRSAMAHKDVAEPPI